MGILDGLIGGFSVAFSPTILLYCLLGSMIGTATGVLPGIGPLAALSILMPVTLSLPPVASLAMLCAIFYGAMYGGAITSILLNIPGEAASVVTAIDGHQLARKGRAGPALGMAALSSFIAGTAGIVALTFFAPALGAAALSFGPPEFSTIILLSFIAVTCMNEGSATKTMITIALGIFLSTIGIDVVSGEERLTFGSVALSGGFSIVAVVVGMFGVAEILEQIEGATGTRDRHSPIGKLWPGREDWKACWRSMVRGTGIGFVLGILPGAGPVSAAFVSYAVERRVSKHPEKFGSGAIEGVAAPESANNAAVAGAMIPMLSLGVPSNAVMALLLGALIIQGIQPGPLLIVQHPDVFWGVIAAMYIGNVMLLILNMPLIGIWVQLLRVPYSLLFPGILIFGAIGAFSDNNNMFGVWVMIAFGVIAYVLRKLHYELGPFILAMVLSPLFEEALRQSLIMSLDGPLIFVTRPISASLVAISVALVLANFVRKIRKGGRQK